MKEYIAEYIVPIEEKGRNQMFDFMNAKPLIRCKDCRYHDGLNRCEVLDMHKTDANDFCSSAEREPET